MANSLWDENAEFFGNKDNSADIGDPLVLLDPNLWPDDDVLPAYYWDETLSKLEQPKINENPEANFKAQTLACPIHIADIIYGRPHSCRGFSAKNMSELTRHLKGTGGRKAHLPYLKLCRTCKIYSLSEEEFKGFHVACKSRRQPRGDAVQAHWQALYKKLNPDATHIPCPYNEKEPFKVPESNLVSPPTLLAPQKLSLGSAEEQLLLPAEDTLADCFPLPDEWEHGQPLHEASFPTFAPVPFDLSPSPNQFLKRRIHDLDDSEPRKARNLTSFYRFSNHLPHVWLPMEENLPAEGNSATRLMKHEGIFLDAAAAADPLEELLLKVADFAQQIVLKVKMTVPEDQHREARVLMKGEFLRHFDAHSPGTPKDPMDSLAAPDNGTYFLSSISYLDSANSSQGARIASQFLIVLHNIYVLLSSTPYKGRGLLHNQNLDFLPH